MDDVAPFFVLYGGLVLVIRIVGARLPDQLGWRRASTAALVVLGAAGVLLGAWASSAGVWVATFFLALGMSLLFPALFSSMVVVGPGIGAWPGGRARSRCSSTWRRASARRCSDWWSASRSYRAAFAVAGLCALGGLALLPRLTVRDGSAEGVT